VIKASHRAIFVNTQQIQVKLHYLRNHIKPVTQKFQDKAVTINYTSWVIYHYRKANLTWLTAAILKMAMTS